MAQSNKVLADHVIQMVASLEPPLSSECCIYRVPHVIRKLNNEAYTPQFISIGPFHHGKRRLRTMEKLKVRYFERFREKTKLNIENLVSAIRDLEGDVRRCYAETSPLSSDNYVQMIMLDASFIIVFFLRNQHQEWTHAEDYTEFAPRLIHDIRLLENQLPFFVIEKLYDFAFPSTQNYPAFRELACSFFKEDNTQGMVLHNDMKIWHFVDLLITFFLPPSRSLPPRNSNEKAMLLYTASQLHEAGVKFKVSSSKCLFVLEFEKGVLKIPSLNLYDFTEPFFRNLMAMEQFYHPLDRYVTDYFKVLDFLINTTEDVDLLVRKGILVNHLGESKAVTTFVNNICKQIIFSGTNSQHFRLCKQLNAFYDVRRHRWKTALCRDYFSNPWRTTATVGASILLLLTLTQTICSIISL